MIDKLTKHKILNFTIDELTDIIHEILNNPLPPENSLFLNIVKMANDILLNESSGVRKTADDELPGGLINLKEFDKVIILPDLHARRKYFFDVLKFTPLDFTKDIIHSLEEDSFAFLCLGDGVHAEGTFAHRWKHAYKEFIKGYKQHSSMDAEISDSFNLMIVVMILKIRYNEKFHFLKGNHENITNETGNGNYSYAKFSNEGAMVYEYFRKFYSNDLLDQYYYFEKNLPLFVIGRNFLASHAEPRSFFDEKSLINYRDNSELIESLTWTDNYTSEEGVVDRYFDYFLPDNHDKMYYFGGHRPIKGLYFQINTDRYVQIHNPYKHIAAVINQNDYIELDRDIVEIPEYTDTDNNDDATIVED